MPIRNSVSIVEKLNNLAENSSIIGTAIGEWSRLFKRT